MSAAGSQSGNDICGMSAALLAEAIARGDLSASEAVEAHIGRIETVNPKLNAVVVKRYEAARSEAREADRRRARGEALGPLHGVPVTIKECIDLEGTPSTFGLASRANVPARKDDIHVARLRQAGAIILGKTNVGQLLLMLESSNPLYGRTSNPWSLERSPGGSSGGEAAIIAAHGSPLGFGTDIGGSSRVPAAFCGIVGFKPTSGRTPDLGRCSVPVGQQAVASQIGVLARHAADIALGLSAINGGTGLNPAVPLGDHREVDLAELRVAFFVDDGMFAPSPSVARGVEEGRRILEAAGAHVEPWQPPDMPGARDLFFGILTADRGRGIAERVKGQPVDERLAALLFASRRSRPTIDALRALLLLFGQKELARNMSAFGYGSARHFWTLVESQMDYRERFLEAFGGDGGPFDLLLCPPCPLVAFTHGASGILGLPGNYSLLANLLGFPAGVVPVGRVRPGEEECKRPTFDIVQKTASKVERASAGLPLSVQVIGRPWQDHLVIAALHAIERSASAHDDYPKTPPDFQQP